MRHSKHSDPREEALRKWAGARLVDPHTELAPPVDQSDLLRSFLRLHGLGPVLVNGPSADASGSSPVPDTGAVAGYVAMEMARQEEFNAVFKKMQSALGLQPIFLKGQALAFSLYAHPWHRPRVDIDALLERDDVPRLVDLLVEQGYQKLVGVDGDLVLPQTIVRKTSHGASHMWDVHWKVSNRPAFTDILTYRTLRESAVPVRAGDISILTPDRPDSLLIACLHLMGHHTADPRLIWLYDIHLLAAALGGTERERFLDKAMDRPPVRAACHAAFELTQRYLPAERTDDLRRALDPGARARQRAGRTYLTRLAEDARAVDQGNRLRFVRQHVFPSADYMMKRFAIRSRWQLPFWYAVRIARAIPKLFQRR